MKNIFKKTSILSLLLLTIVSCTTDDNYTVPVAENSPVLLSPEEGTSIVLNEVSKTNPAITMAWNHGTYTVPTEITYTVQLAMTGTSFATPIDAGTTTARVFTLTVEQLNDFAVTAGLTAGQQGGLDLRVVSSLGETADVPMISNVISINVTPYAVVIPEEPEIPEQPFNLYLVGAPQAYYGLTAWTPETAIPLRYIGDGTTKVFEGYVKIGTDDGFKFVGVQGTWAENDAAGNYGKGDADGVLLNAGSSGDIKPAATDGNGFYYVWVDLDNLAYKSVKMNWGIIGDSTPGGWDNETPMTYDFDNNKFTLSTTLTAAELKFRAGNAGTFIANDAWKFNVGNSTPMVAHNPAAPNFAVTAGPHDIELSIDIMGNATVSGL